MNMIEPNEPANVDNDELVPITPLVSSKSLVDVMGDPTGALKNRTAMTTLH